MIIHCCGMDRTGKSTLCNKLVKKYNAEYTHFSNPKNMQEAKDDYFNFLDNVDNNINYVCDRFHDGEFVYAPIYRKYIADYLFEIENEILKHNYLLIFVEAELKTIIERIKLDGEDFVKEEHYKLVIKNFLNYLKMQNLPFIKINTTYENKDMAYESAIQGIDNLNIIWNYIKMNNKNPLELPSGNIRGDKMIINYKSHIHDNSKYFVSNDDYDFNTWKTTLFINDDYEFCIKSILLQIKLIKPKVIIVFEDKTFEIINDLLKEQKLKISIYKQ